MLLLLKKEQQDLSSGGQGLSQSLSSFKMKECSHFFIEVGNTAGVGRKHCGISHLQRAEMGKGDKDTVDVRHKVSRDLS